MGEIDEAVLPAAETSPKPRHPQIRGLDGIRALAAGLVLCYHLVPGWRGAGFVGVDMFFVLSGFLITSLLMRDISVRGKIAFRRFWARRLRRLLPAIVFATISVVGLARLVGGDAMVQLPWQAVGSLTSTYNWLEIAHDAPYFGQRSPLLLTNMWSLAVEMQFYLVWPLLLLVVLRFVPQRLTPWVAMGLAGASAGLNWYFAHVDGALTRAYVGTDSHAFGLMLGASIALWLPRIMVEEQPKLSPQKRRLWGLLAWVGLLGALGIGIFVRTGPWMYPWGMLAASALIALTIRGLLPDALSLPSRVLVKFLGSKPMVWLGVRSYSLYLWHWPLWVIAYFALRWSGAATGLLVLVLSLLMAEVSYRFVENPIRLHGFKWWIQQAGESPRFRQRIMAGGAALMLALFVWAMITSPSRSSTEQQFDLVGQMPAQAAPAQSADTEVDTPDEQDPVANASLPALLIGWQADYAAAVEAAKPPPEPIRGDQVTVIGDSVTIMAEPQLDERLPGIYVDAEVSRPMLNLPTIVEQVRTDGLLREYVVISLATNGTVQDEEIGAMFEALGPEHKIVLVTGYGPDFDWWIFEANDKIREVAGNHQEQIRVADWAPIAEANLDNLAGDRVHPDEFAAALYADEVVRALNSFN